MDPLFKFTVVMAFLIMIAAVFNKPQCSNSKD
jgi:hypothetical protein